MMPIAAAAGLLADLAVSAETIAGIKEILSRNIEDLEAKPLDRTSQSAFGQSYWGGQLGHHTSIAERHVVEAINDLVVGLDGYRASVEWAYAHIEETDGGVGGSMNNITVQIDESRFNQAAACVDQPDLETNPTCEIPTGDS